MRNGKYETVMEVFDDKSIRAIGIIGDINQAKSNLIYHCMKEYGKTFVDKVYSYGLHMDVKNVTKINMVEELEGISNSVIFIDEYASLFSLSNRKQVEKFEATMRTIFQHKFNNTVIICGLPHNFNKFLSGLLQVLIFKQCRLEDFIQRSSPQQAVTAFSPAGLHHVEKGSAILKMPKDYALIYDVTKSDSKWSEVNVPYEKEFDSKTLLCQDIRVRRDDKKLEKILDTMNK
jgi:hypothetical protein